MVVLLAVVALARPAITGGVETADFPAVVGLYASQGGFAGDNFCSGTLVEPDAVVTCAHCVDRLREYEEGNYDVFVLVGTAAAGGIDTFAKVREAVQDPGWVPGSEVDTEDGTDLAVLRLEEPVAGVEPIPLNEDPVDDSWLGTDLTYVGWGATTEAQTDGGLKRTVTIPVTSYDALWITHGEAFSGLNTCFGDSGGAVLRTGDDGVLRLVGIPAVIWAHDETQDICVDGWGWDLRVDARRDFVRDTLAAWDVPPTDTAAPPADPAESPAEPAGCGCGRSGGSSGWVGVVAALLLARSAGRHPFPIPTEATGFHTRSKP
jgi:hypothetical protein